MAHELEQLFVAAQDRELPPAAFISRLESLHARLLGAGADTPEMVERRHSASLAHRRLATDIDRHHHLELLAEAARSRRARQPLRWVPDETARESLRAPERYERL